MKKIRGDEAPILPVVYQLVHFGAPHHDPAAPHSHLAQKDTAKTGGGLFGGTLCSGRSINVAHLGLALTDS